MAEDEQTQKKFRPKRKKSAVERDCHGAESISKEEFSPICSKMIKSQAPVVQWGE